GSLGSTTSARTSPPVGPVIRQSLEYGTPSTEEPACAVDKYEMARDVKDIASNRLKKNRFMNFVSLFLIVCNWRPFVVPHAHYSPLRSSFRYLNGLFRWLVG